MVNWLKDWIAWTHNDAGGEKPKREEEKKMFISNKTRKKNGMEQCKNSGKFEMNATKNRLSWQFTLQMGMKAERAKEEKKIRALWTFSIKYRLF